MVKIGIDLYNKTDLKKIEFRDKIKIIDVTRVKKGFR